jgi:hypothetical protein
VGNVYAFEHRALPEAATTEVCGKRVYDAEGEDALDRAGDETESQLVRVVFVPGLDVESQER